MTKDEISTLYFEWLYHICNKQYCQNIAYRKLFFRLHEIDFTYTIPLDGNRADDGINLRYTFGNEKAYAAPVIAACLDDRPCSVLEMLIALAIRCEVQIMDDPDVGDRTGLWFWTMVDNLGLSSMTDAGFNRDYVDKAIHKFLNREYGRNGEGGLFLIKHCRRDLRTVEIWYQMCWYLDKIIGGNHDT